MRVASSSSSAIVEEFELLPNPPKKTDFTVAPKSKMNFREARISTAMEEYLRKRDAAGTGIILITISVFFRQCCHFFSVSDRLYNTELQQYETGKRHLARMMGEDPDTFTQRQIDVSDSAHSCLFYDLLSLTTYITFPVLECDKVLVSIWIV